MIRKKLSVQNTKEQVCFDKLGGIDFSEQLVHCALPEKLQKV